ncbi:MAG: ABC transporter substrate-binding protein [Beutenbergiaceae bacterium]
MKRKTSRISAVAAGFAAAALVAAGCAAPDTTGGGGDGGGEGSDANFLKIAWLGNEKAGIDAIVAAFQEENPDVEIVVTTADTAQYQATLRTELSTGTAADVMYVWPANGNTGAIRQLNAGEYLMDLSDQSWVEDYPDYIRDLTSDDGRVLVMAALATSFSPIYNQTVLDELGLQAPSSWSEVVPFCQAAMDAGKVAYAMPGNHAYGGQTAYYNLVPDLVYGTGTEFDSELADGDTTFTDHPGYVEATDKFQEMIDEGCFQPNSTGTPYDESNRMLAAGEALGSFFIGTRLAPLQEAAPDGDFRLYPFHSDDDENTNAMALSTQGGAAIYNESPRKDLALEFVNFLADNLAIYQAAHPGTVPTITKDFSTDDPNAQTLVEYIDNGWAVHFLNQEWPNARAETAMNVGLTAMLAGSGTGQEMLETMQSEYETE